MSGQGYKQYPTFKRKLNIFITSIPRRSHFLHFLKTFSYAALLNIYFQKWNINHRSEIDKKHLCANICFTILGRISRWDYIKMVFDFKKWRKDSVSLMSSTISGIYATLLICIYLTFSFTGLVKFPNMKTYQDQSEPDLQGYLEKNGFFIYLFLGCNLYYVYILISLVRAKK